MSGVIEPIQKLATDMQFKLDKNKHKACDVMNADGDGRGWVHCEHDWLSGRIEDELDELDVALEAYRIDRTPDNAKKVQLECADIANFAMMIHDNVNDEQNSL